MVRKNNPVTPLSSEDINCCPCPPTPKVPGAVVSVRKVNGKTGDVEIVEGKLTQDLTTGIAVGGVPVGTVFSAGTSFDTILRQIFISKTIERIAITSSPLKTSYIVGEAFDTTGMVVVAYFNDGTYQQVSGYTVSPSGPLTLEDTTITITYQDKTATQPITVSAGGIKIYHGNCATLPTTNQEIESLTLDESKTKASLISSGYIILNNTPDNEYMVLAVKKSDEINCYDIKANGFSVEVVETEVGDYYLYHQDNPATGTYTMTYSFAEA